MKKQPGFTFIELLIAIVVLNILTVIVVSNVFQYTQKSKDSAIKESLHSVADAVTSYVYSGGSYAAFGGDSASGFASIQRGIQKAGSTAYFFGDSAGWASCAQLVNAKAFYWCVDSTGNKIQLSGTTKCNTQASWIYDSCAAAQAGGA